MKKHFVAVLISFIVAFAFGVGSMVFLGVSFGEFSYWEFIYTIMMGIAIVLLIWSKRIPMHAYAACFIGYVALLLKFLCWGIYNVEKITSWYNVLNGVLNFVIAFVIFDAAIFTAHALLGIKSLAKIAAILNLVLEGLVIILIITTLIFDVGRVTGTNMAIVRLIFEKLCLLGVVVVPGLALLLVKDKQAK